MKKVFAISCISLMVWGCGHKMTPTTSTQKPSIDNSISGSSATATPTSMGTVTPTTGTSADAMAAAKAVPATASTEPIILGMKVYNEKCGRCHNLKVVQDYTADRWVSIMQVMAMKANLSETEKENVLVYVKTNAKKG